VIAALAVGGAGNIVPENDGQYEQYGNEHKRYSIPFGYHGCVFKRVPLWGLAPTQAGAMDSILNT
jgi:hypothetical protein